MPVEIFAVTWSPCLLWHGHLVYCCMVALFTQSEGKPISVLRQQLPCFHMNTCSKFRDIVSPCLFQVQHGNPSLYQMSPYYMAMLSPYYMYHNHTWLKSQCVTKFLLIVLNVSGVETVLSVLSTCCMLNRMNFTWHLVSTIRIRIYLLCRDMVAPYRGHHLQLSEDMLWKILKNRNHYENHHRHHHYYHFFIITIIIIIIIISIIINRASDTRLQRQLI